METIMSKDNYEIGTIDIPGGHGRSVQNQFIQQTQASDNLALIYPGFRYNCDKPLLYYTTQILLQRGYDVLQLRSNYRTQEFKDLSKAEQTIQLIEDGKALLDSGLQTKSYTNILFVGKSLGTLIMAFILNEDHDLFRAKTIWLTPLLHLPPVSQAVCETTSPAIIAGSTADPAFESESVNKIKSMTNVVTLSYQDANHSLEIPDDPLKSLQILNQVTENLINFLS
jgi:hypothetical protein